MDISDVRTAFRPLALTLPRVALVLFCGAVAIIAAGEIRRAVRARRGRRLLVAWTVALLATFGSCLAFRNLAQLGRRVASAEPLTLAGLIAFASQECVPIAVAAAMGLLLAARRWRPGGGRDASAAAILAELPDRAAAIGALGEALGAGRLRERGRPTLRNVILPSGTHSVKIDALVCAADGIVVLETKTWSGFVSGAADSARWMRRGKDGRVDVLPNAVRQNLAHVVAVESIVMDRALWVRGYVVSAGSATFSTELSPYVVPLDNLGAVLRAHSRPGAGDNAAINRAWARLQIEATRSGPRRAAHIVRARSHKGFFRNGVNLGRWRAECASPPRETPRFEEC